MEHIFENTFYISSEHLRMQDFCNFTENGHKISNCEEKDCNIVRFFDKS